MEIIQKGAQRTEVAGRGRDLPELVARIGHLDQTAVVVGAALGEVPRGVWEGLRFHALAAGITLQSEPLTVLGREREVVAIAKLDRHSSWLSHLGCTFPDRHAAVFEKRRHFVDSADDFFAEYPAIDTSASNQHQDSDDRQSDQQFDQGEAFTDCFHAVLQVNPIQQCANGNTTMGWHPASHSTGQNNFTSSSSSSCQILRKKYTLCITFLTFYAIIQLSHFRRSSCHPW